MAINLISAIYELIDHGYVRLPVRETLTWLTLAEYANERRNDGLARMGSRRLARRTGMSHGNAGYALQGLQANERIELANGPLRPGAWPVWRVWTQKSAQDYAQLTAEKADKTVQPSGRLPPRQTVQRGGQTVQRGGQTVQRGEHIPDPGNPEGANKAPRRVTVSPSETRGATLRSAGSAPRRARGPRTATPPASGELRAARPADRSPPTSGAGAPARGEVGGAPTSGELPASGTPPAPGGGSRDGLSEDSVEWRRAMNAFRAGKGRAPHSSYELNKWWDRYLVQACNAFEAVNDETPIGITGVELIDWFERQAAESYSEEAK